MDNNAIILCSGIGRRMSPILSCNKSLLHIKGNEPNVVRTCRILRGRGIESIVIAAHPDNAYAFYKIQRDLATEGIDIIVKVVEEYTPGCNNIVSMKSVSNYIGNTFVIEGDQYLINEECSFLRGEPYPTSRFFTQRREPEDWAVKCEFLDVGRVSKILHFNSNPTLDFCLAGISYISLKDSCEIIGALNSSTSTDIYWEEVIDLHKTEFINHRCYSPYSLEYDNIHDLIRKDLMDPQDIANLVDDYGSAVRLDSMTNTSYLVTYRGRKKVLRIPGYGTEKFVNRIREASIENYVWDNSYIAPKSSYYSDYHVKMTAYLEPKYYHILTSLKEFPAVLGTLRSLHNMPIPDDEEFVNLCTMNVDSELSAYEAIFLEVPTQYSEYWTLRSKVLDIVNSYPNTGLVHRDLVPRNILVSECKDSTWDVKLIDWEYACIFNKYWDLASLACEYADEYIKNPRVASEYLDVLISVIYAIYPDCDMKDIYLWIAVVDFVWSSWSLAKIKLGDPVEEYLSRRYNRCKDLLERYYKEV